MPYLTLVRGKKRQPARHGAAQHGTALGAGLNDWKSSPQGLAAVSKQRERSTPPEEELREDCAHLSASSEQLQRRRWRWQHRLPRPRETARGLTRKSRTKTKNIYVCNVQINECAGEWDSPLQCCRTLDHGSRKPVRFMEQRQVSGGRRLLFSSRPSASRGGGGRADCVGMEEELPWLRSRAGNVSTRVFHPPPPSRTALSLLCDDAHPLPHHPLPALQT